MAFDSTSGFLAKQVFASYGGTRLRGATDIQNVGANGVASVQQITTLESDNVEQITGIVDPGQISMTFIADPTSPDYDELRTAQSNHTEAEFRAVFGTGPAGGVTDGSGWTTGSAAVGSGAGAITYSSNVISIPADSQSGLPPIRVGHYVKWGAGNDDVSAITAVSGGGSAALEVSATGVTLGTSLTFIRPAFEFRRNCRVLELAHSPQVDTPFGMNLVLLPTGNGTFAKGNPALQI